MSVGSQHPFPTDVRADARGAFFERISSDRKASHYVVVRPTRYMGERDVELIEKGYFTAEELFPQLRRLGRPPRSDALWLYELETFDVAREHHENQETFADNSRNYVSMIVDDWDELVDYCARVLQVSSSQFVKSWQTSYPQS